MDLENWEDDLKEIWTKLGQIPDKAFIGIVKCHTETIRVMGLHSIADFEMACALDSTGFEKEAEPLYRSAIHTGLVGIRRRRANIQLASTLRNNGKIEESIEILQKEKEHYSDELDDAVNAFLALSFSFINEDKKALALALESLSQHLPRYNQSVLNYSKRLQ